MASSHLAVDLDAEEAPEKGEKNYHFCFYGDSEAGPCGGPRERLF